MISLLIVTQSLGICVCICKCFRFLHSDYFCMIAICRREIYASYFLEECNITVHITGL